MSPWIAASCALLAVICLGRPPMALRVDCCSEPVGIGRGPVLLAAAIMGAFVVASGLSPPETAAVALGGLVVQRTVRRRMRRRVHGDRAAAVVEVTFALAAELRAGRTPAQALLGVAEIAGPLEPALRSAYGAVSIGADAATELSVAATLPGAERLRPVAAAWAVTTSAGGRIATVLERLSEAMDDDDELRRELEAAMAGPRATMMLLAGLPVLGLLLGQSVGAHPIELLVQRPLGWGLLAAATGLDAVGIVVMRAIVSRAHAP